MLTGLVRNFVSLGSATYFEKSRLQATYNGDNEAPNESDLQMILMTLAGKDPDMRPQIAFTTILQKLESSQSKFKWNYLVKNLIILDRCLEERYFVQDIANLKINHVETYSEQDPLYQTLQVDQYLRLYFRYIKFKAFVYSKKNTSFNMNREEIKPFFMTYEPAMIFDEFSMSQKLQAILMEVANTDKKGLLKFKVNQYVYLLLLSTLINLFSTQYIATLALMEKLVTMSQDEAQEFKTLYTRFLKQNEELLSFINSHKYIDGYANINTQDFSKCDSRIIVAIDDYLLIQKNQECQIDLPEEIIFEDGQELIFVKNLKISRKSTIKDQLEESIPHQQTLENHRHQVRKFDQRVQEFNFQCDNIETFNEILWSSFGNNYCSDYKSIHFYRKQSEIREGIRYVLGQEEDQEEEEINFTQSLEVESIHDLKFYKEFVKAKTSQLETDTNTPPQSNQLKINPANNSFDDFQFIKGNQYESTESKAQTKTKFEIEDFNYEN